MKKFNAKIELYLHELNYETQSSANTCQVLQRTSMITFVHILSLSVVTTRQVRPFVGLLKIIVG